MPQPANQYGMDSRRPTLCGAMEPARTIPVTTQLMLNQTGLQAVVWSGQSVDVMPAHFEVLPQVAGTFNVAVFRVQLDPPDLLEVGRLGADEE